MQEKVKHYELRIKKLENIIESGLNQDFHRSGNLTKVFKDASDNFIGVGETAEQTPEDGDESTQGGILPQPGIDTNLLINSQLSRNATTNSKLEAMRDNYTFERQKLVLKKGFSDINKKSEGIQKKHKSPTGKAAYMNKGRTLLVQDLDGPSLAAYSTRQ
jgi:hypothetical protein